MRTISFSAGAPWRDDAMLAALYVSQALPMGLAWFGLPPWLRAQDVGLEVIGAMMLAVLPWALKFLWAAPVERYCMRRGCRPAISAAQLAAALAYGLLAFVDVAAAPFLGIALLVLLNGLCATQDVATDRYAILRRGAAGAARVNTSRFAGFTIGMLAGGSGLLVTAPHFGWAVFMLACAAWMLGMAVAARRLREPAALSRGDAPAPSRASLRAFLAGRPLALRLLGIAVVFRCAHAIGDGMLKAFWVDHGVTLDQVAALTTLNFTLFGLVGAPLGAWLVARRQASAGSVAVICGGVTALLLGALGLVAHLGIGIRTLPSWDWLYVALPAVQAIVDGASSLAFFTLFMRWSVGTQPGTDFSLFLCAESLGGIVIASLAGLVAANLGYGLHFISGAGLTLLAMLYVWRTLRLIPTIPAGASSGQPSAEASHAVA
ncbi:hypothetical protein [Thauera aromatica]|uniref:AmpG permease n=1 Tax=Thauera aromatica K172 TaxID=44139 RepID=A0A2R4BIU6_THAAR|nr:hypothetical protein [Thauera aromatica]AVR87247.1 AmpG permease [Thauera aromatica K172]